MEDRSTRRVLAESCDISAEELARLAKDDAWEVRYRVAKNKNTQYHKVR